MWAFIALEAQTQLCEGLSPKQNKASCLHTVSGLNTQNLIKNCCPMQMWSPYFKH